MSAVRPDIFGDPLLNPHAEGGAETDVRKAPPARQTSTSPTRDLELEDSDTDSINDPISVTDSERLRLRAPETPPASEAPSSPIEADNDPPSENGETNLINQPEQPIEPNQDQPREQTSSGDTSKEKQHEYNLRDRSTRRSWKDLYKRVKRSASKSLDRIKGGRKKT